MKLVIVTPYFYPKVGGLENYALEIARGLLKQNWQVTIITSNHEEQEQLVEEHFGLTIHRLPIQFKVSNTPVNLGWQKQIEKLLRAIKPDVVNVHLPVPFIGDMAVAAAKQLQIPVVTTYHNDIVKDSLVYSLISRLYYTVLGHSTLRDSQKIIVTSASYARSSPYLRQYLSKTETVPPGIWLAKASKKTKKAQPYVLFVGQLDATHRHKGLEYLIQSFGLLKHHQPQLKLVVAGKGNDFSYYQRQIAEKGIQDTVEMLGFVIDSELLSLYAGALCLCLPSTTEAEGFGMVVIEAAAQQTPAIGSTVGGIAESIVNGETGILVPPADPAAIATAIRKLLDQTELRDKLGKNAYERVKHSFTWQKQIDKTNQVLNSLL